MSTKKTDSICLADTTANPAPLGLLGFGLTTILLNIHNAGFYGMNSAIIGMGLFVGGTAQIIAGIMEWKKNNTFGTTAFIAYGSFWISLVVILVFPKLGLCEASNAAAMGWYLSVWGLFTLGMFFGTLRLNRALQVVFLSLTILFFMLAAGDFSGIHGITLAAGWVGLLCGFSAFYASIAQILNEVYGRVVLPLGPVKK
jgi:uncharacterized protein